MPNRRRLPLIIGSIVLHAAVATTMVVSSAWSVERLDHERASVSLAVMLPPPAAPSGSPAGEAAKFTPKTKKQVPKTLTQPQKLDTSPTPSTGGAAPGNGQGTGTGPGNNPDGNDDDIGTCTGPDCGPPISTTPPQPEVHIPPPRVEQPTIVPPTALKRTGGDVNLLPSDAVKTQMLREDHKRVVAAVKVCLDGSGAIASVGQLSSTGYPTYDATIVNGIRASWRYQPYTVNGKGVPACAVVTFVYSIK